MRLHDGMTNAEIVSAVAEKFASVKAAAGYFSADLPNHQWVLLKAGAPSPQGHSGILLIPAMAANKIDYDDVK